MRCHALNLGLLALISSLMGCSGPPGPDVVHIPSGQYEIAFSTAVDMVRERGWEPEFMDRRSGVIETAPVQAGSLLEPWHLNTSDTGAMLAYTVSKNRTRARLEFRPAGTESLTTSAPEAISEADYLGLTPTVDLAKTTMPLDLRAWVYTERGVTPNRMISHWTGRMLARPRPVSDDPQWETPPNGPMWIPADRDRHAEALLLAAIAKSLQTASNVPTDGSRTPKTAQIDP